MNRAGKALFLVLLGVFGVWMQFSHLFRDGMAYIPGDMGDSRLINLFLEHNYRFFVTGQEHSYWSPGWLFYPLPNGFAMSDVLTSVSWIYAAFRSLGYDYLESYQFWMLSCSSLNYLSAFFLVRAIGAGSIASAAGAYVYAFSMARMGYLNHPQLMAGFWIPLTLLAMFHFFKQRSAWKSGFAIVLAGIGLSMQLWASFYLGWFLALIVCITLPVCLMRRSLRSALIAKVRTSLPAIVLGGAVSLATVYPLLKRYLVTKADFGSRSWIEVSDLLPTLASHLMPHPGSYLYGWYFASLVKDMGPFSEKYLFSGWLVWVAPFVLLALWFFRRSSHRSADRVHPDFIWTAPLVAIICLVLVTRYTQWDSVWNIVYHGFPGASGVRAVGRFIHVVLIPIAISFALLLHAVETRMQGFRKVAAVILLLAVMLLENSAHQNYAFAKAEHRSRIEALSERVRAAGPQCDSFYLQNLEPVFKTQIDAMWVSMLTGIPTANGYSGFVPVEYDRLLLNSDQPVKEHQVAVWNEKNMKSGIRTCILN